MNMVLKDEIGILELKYNVFPFYSVYNYTKLRFLLGKNTLYYSKSEFEESVKNPVVLHLLDIGQGHPWNIRNYNPYRDL